MASDQKWFVAVMEVIAGSLNLCDWCNCADPDTISEVPTAKSPSSRSSIYCIWHGNTNSMESSPSWGSNSCSATQKNTNVLWNKMVRYRIHKSPPLVSTVWHTNLVQTLHPIDLSSILILSSHLYPCFRNGLLFLNPSYQYPSAFLRAIRCVNLLLIDFINLIKSADAYKLNVVQTPVRFGTRFNYISDI